MLRPFVLKKANDFWAGVAGSGGQRCRYDLFLLFARHFTCRNKEEMLVGCVVCWPECWCRKRCMWRLNMKWRRCWMSSEEQLEDAIVAQQLISQPWYATTTACPRQPRPLQANTATAEAFSLCQSVRCARVGYQPMPPSRLSVLLPATKGGFLFQIVLKNVETLAFARGRCGSVVLPS